MKTSKSNVVFWGNRKEFICQLRAGDVVTLADRVEQGRLRHSAYEFNVAFKIVPAGMLVTRAQGKDYDGVSPTTPVAIPTEREMQRVCPVCHTTFAPLSPNQQTCGKGKCPRRFQEIKVMRCECNRGPRISRDRGCAQCEAESRRFWDSVTDHKRRLELAERADNQERIGMTRFAEEWTRENREHNNRLTCDHLFGR